MNLAVIAAIGLLIAAVFVIAVARLFAPARRKEPSAENNWEQRLSDENPSLDRANDAPYDNIERGFSIALGTGDQS